MKAAAGILIFMLLQPQEKVVLTWNPPAGKVLIAKAKAKFTYPGKSENSFECDSELHPTGDTVKAGRVFTLRVHRLHSLLKEKAKDKEKESEVLFERGKETVLKGEALEGAGPFKGIGDDHQAVVSSLGRRDSDQLNDHLAETMCLGVVDLQLSPDAVGTGSTWEADTVIPLDGPDFHGKLKYKVEKVEKGKTARISIKVLETEEDESSWEGHGFLAYSFEEALVRAFEFTLTRKDKNGKTTASFDQSVSLAFKD